MVTRGRLATVVRKALDLADKKSLLMHRHCCVILDQRGNPVHFAVNRRLRNDNGFVCRNRHVSAKHSHHAEQMAIFGALRRLRRRGKKALCGHMALVVRINRLGRPCMSKPCKSCQRLLAGRGIAVVMYSTADGIVRDCLRK